MPNDIPIAVYPVKRVPSHTVVGGFRTRGPPGILDRMPADETAAEATPERARGERIRSAYLAKGWTRADFHRKLAELAQPLQYHTVASWETGAMPDPMRLVHIERLTGKTVRWLVTGEDTTIEETETVPAIVEEFIASNARVTAAQAERLRRTRWKSLAASLAIDLSIGFVRNAWLEMVDSAGQEVEKPARRPGVREMPAAKKR